MTTSEDTGFDQDFRAVEAFLDALGDTVLDWRYKGFGSLPAPLTVDQVHHSRVDLHALGTPMMSVAQDAVRENDVAMAVWCRARDLQLEPHGKTTMAPTLWLGQLNAGAVGITVATASQVRAARAFGVSRIQLASELVNASDIAWVAAELEADPTFEFLCWVDSVEDVSRIDSALAGRVPGRQIRVCVEVGAAEGRTGARGLPEVLTVARAVLASQRVALAGVSGYEGAVPGAGTDPAGLRAVDDYLSSVASAHAELLPSYETPEVIITAGGSAYFDRVARVLGPLVDRSAPRPVNVVLRSGAYVVHDDLHYREVTPSTRGDGPSLRAAIHVWAGVLSRPQPDLVILDAGRRDLPFDLGLPVPLSASRAGTPRTPVDLGCATIARLNDQHAFVQVSPECELAVGDVVKLGLSHPCTAFDKWRAIAVIDSADVQEPRLTDVALTFF